MGANCCRPILIRLGIIKLPRPSNRTIYVGGQPLRPDQPIIRDPSLDEDYPDNEIVSSRYTVWNFLPKNLFEQLQRIANFYFLCIAIIQLFIDSPVNPITSILPLLFVISVTMLKQGYEDFLRHVADRRVNNYPTEVVMDGQVFNIQSRDIKVGDIVRCRADETFPCDLVMLSSSDPSGKCYVTTASLDGETNLKNFLGLDDFKHFVSPADISNKLRAQIQCEHPVTDLYKFTGKINIQIQMAGAPVTRPLSAANLLLRGARLKNTDFIYGCAVYTGQDTKMVLNSMGKSNKFSQVERRLNKFLVLYLLLIGSITIFCTSMKYILSQLSPTIYNAWYIPYESITAWRVVQDFLGFVVLFNYLIPISLYVTIEVQKFFGSMFFALDLTMYDDKSNNAAKANTSDLNEELGQVEYLFSDKTGTLTENDMQFRRCFVGGQRYRDVEGALYTVSDDNGGPGEAVDLVMGGNVKGKASRELEEFMTVLALCHTVRVEQRGLYSAIPGGQVIKGGQENKAATLDKQGQPPSADGKDYDYQASSPDEKAFVEACRSYGIIYHGVNDDNEHLVTFHGVPRYFRVLQVLEFDSDRKCMSVFIRYDDNTVHLHCKGAESAMLPKAAPNGQISTHTLMDHVTEYAREGLRTLVIGTKQISEKEFSALQDELLIASGSLENREAKVSAVYAKVERNLRLIGCTGIEDRLQDGVKETIEHLREAGIQVWILTGDKEETAVNISHSAGHIADGMKEVRITGHQDIDSCRRALLVQREGVLADPGTEFALVVDGQSLSYAIKDPLKSVLTDLCVLAATVLCCRMTPLQKAEVVNLIKESVKPTPVTAAVGDGANDVSMILAAHVGIGLFGKEGRQAVRSADYALARFRYLRPAFLFHGHLYYIRIANLVQYFFYKNIAFVTLQLYFNFFCAFSAQTIFDSVYLMFYNLTFTSFPIMLYGLFELHMSREELLRKPELYQRIARNSYLTFKQFAFWNLLGVWHSLVAFFSVYAVYAFNDSMGSDGKGTDVISMGTLQLVIIFFIVTIKLLLITSFWQGFTALGLGVTFGGNIGLVLIANSYMIWSIDSGNMFWVWYTIFSYASTWLLLVFAIITALLPDIIFKAWTEQNASLEKLDMSTNNSASSRRAADRLRIIEILLADKNRELPSPRERHRSIECWRSSFHRSPSKADSTTSPIRQLQQQQTLQPGSNSASWQPVNGDSHDWPDKPRSHSTASAPPRVLQTAADTELIPLPSTRIVNSSYSSPPQISATSKF